MASDSLVSELNAFDKEPLALRGISFLENNDKIIITRGASLELVLKDKTAGWVYKGPIVADSPGEAKNLNSKFGGALQKFQEISLKGSRTNDHSQSVHSHTISEIRTFEKNSFITSGFDGQVVFWNL